MSNEISNNILEVPTIIIYDRKQGGFDCNGL